MNELITLGAARLVNEIRSGRVTPLEAVDAHIARIEAVNPLLNALVTPLFDRARDQARRATEKLARGPAELPPLFGLPVTVKDSLPVKGARFTAGSILYRDRVAGDDAEAVRRLEHAGAIILGKTNCPEMCAAAETRNLLFGLTRNPWGLDRSAGGSSGGEGALIAAGGSPLGLGSDVAGSIRIPSAFCGIAGLKPTPGRIPDQGHVPGVPPAMASWNVVGPLARRIEDLALVLSVLSDTPVIPHTTVDVRGRSVLVPRALPLMQESPEMAQAVSNAAEALADADMKVHVDVSLPLAQVSLHGIGVLFQEWMPLIRRELGGGEPIGLWEELIGNWRGTARVSASVLAGLFGLSIMGPLVRLFGIPDPAALRKLRFEVLDAMGPGNVLLWPVFPVEAPKHGFVWDPRRFPIYTGVFNALGFPVVVVPVGFSKNGLPLGLQVVAGPGEDETALAVAAELETRLGGARMAPMPLDQPEQYREKHRPGPVH